jgi:hypothetical protein
MEPSEKQRENNARRGEAILLRLILALEVMRHFDNEQDIGVTLALCRLRRMHVELRNENELQFGPVESRIAIVVE